MGGTSNSAEICIVDKLSDVMKCVGLIMLSVALVLKELK